ncbi:MAG TPA: hypothetical protein VEZ90_11660 [Blastocatellia bacterium]|nr:hypothetical protein [Blastocatellia bacterium]
MDQDKKQEAAKDLVELAREVEELDSARSDLLKRVEDIRTRLLNAGKRTRSVQGAVEMLREHVATSAVTAANLRAIRDEMRETGQSVTEVSSDAVGLLFESEGLMDSLSEAEEQMERLLRILVEGKSSDPVGH